VRTAVRRGGQFCCSFVVNLLQYPCAKNYQNIMWFDKAMAKIKGCNFWPSSVVVVVVIVVVVIIDNDNDDNDDDDNENDDDDDNNNNKSTQRVQTRPRSLHCRRVVTEYNIVQIPYLIRLLQRRPLVSDSISWKCVSAVLRKVKTGLGSGSAPNVITLRGQTPAHGYHIWSTFVNAVASYPAYRQDE